MKLGIFSLLCCGLAFGQDPPPPPLAPALPTKTIAIIRDTPSPYFDSLIDGFKEELLPLSQDQYRLKLKTVRVQDGNSAKTLRDVLADPEIDAIFTAGIASSYYARQIPAEIFTKPIIAGAIEFTDLQNTLISPDGTSSVPNYSFVLVPDRILSDVRALAQLAGTKVIDGFIDPEVVPIIGKDISEQLARLEKATGLTLRVHPINRSNFTDLSPIPPDVKAVYVPLIPSMSREDRARLFAALTDRKLVHLSMMGPKDVEAGAFSTLGPDTIATLERRLALNLHQALLGIDTSLLPVTLRLADRLTINLATAKKIGWSPDYDTSLSATFINESDIRPSSGTLTLEGVMARAAKINPDITASRAAWQEAAANSDVARAGFSTTANFNVQGSLTSTQDRINRLGAANTQGGTLGFEVNRLLYSDRLYSQIQALDEITIATTHDIESVTLDTIADTATAYLNALQAEALYQIQRENLTLVQENLQLADLRLNIGSKDETDTLRWRASEAATRSNLIQADSDRRNARTALNVLILAPTDSHWDLTDIPPLGEEDSYVFQPLVDLIDRENEFEEFIKFTKSLSTVQSPELKAFHRNLVAQGITLRERQRRYLRPEISLSAGVNRIIQDSNLSSSDAQNDWTVGIGFTIPFLERDLRNAETRQIQAAIAQLEAQRLSAAYLIEQRALAAGYGIAASHPAMRLSRQARSDAEKNYERVREQYRLGQIDVVTLLDSQSNLLTQKQSEAVSLYTYLKDVVALQRAIAWFEYAKTDAEKNALLRQFKNYLQTGSLFMKALPAK